MAAQFAIVCARFNEDVTTKLLDGALAAFRDAKVADTRLDVIHVPGAFELPLAAKALALTGRFAAVICLGAVIRGDTSHYDYVCRAATDGILQAGLATGVPIIFGVLTCENDEQALARAGGAEGNKGNDAVHAALAMADVMSRLRN